MKTTHMILPFFSTVILIMSQLPVPAQTQISCNTPEASQFDFWLGEWELTWNDTLHGTNVITRELGGCVIQENFNDPNSGFSGKSLSVYNVPKHQWEQTWVDNTGVYMAFAGEFKDGQMTLGRSFTGPKGKTLYQRMVFFDISRDSFSWSWESSLDEGKTWKQNWLIHYARKH